MRSPKKKTKSPDTVYREPGFGDPFWIPDAVRRVSGFFGWGIGYVEQQPEGLVMVTFTGGSGDVGSMPGMVWEMSLAVVEKMDKRLGPTRRTTDARSDIDRLFDL